MPVWSHPLPDTGPGTSPSQSSQSQSSQSSSSSMVTHTDEEKKENETEFVGRETRPKRISGPSHRRRQELPQPDVSFKKPKRRPRVNPFKSSTTRRRENESMSRYVGAVPLSMSRYDEHDASLLFRNTGTVTNEMAIGRVKAGSLTQDVKKFAHNVWYTGLGYQVKKFLGYETTKKDYTKKKISIDTGAIEGLGMLGAPAVYVGQPSSRYPSKKIETTISMTTPSGMVKTAGGAFLSGAFAVLDMPIILGHMAVDKEYRKAVIQGLKESPKEFRKSMARAPFATLVSVPLSLMGGYASARALDVAATKAVGYVRTRGLPEVPAEKVVNKQVITGEKVFAEYPSNLARSTSVKAKVQYLNKVNKGPKTAIEKATGLQPKGRYLGLHATDREFARVTKVAVGTSESPGLYVAPEASPYFLRLGVPAQKPPTSSSLKSLFSKPLFMKRPTLIAVYTDDVTAYPSNIKSLAQYNKYVMSQAGSGKNIITFASTRMGKPEMESIIPPGTLLQQVSKGARTTWMGVKVPIRIYKASPGGSGSKLMSSISTIASSGSSLGLETVPHGTYSLLGGAASLLSSAARAGSLTSGFTKTTKSGKKSSRKKSSSRVVRPRYSYLPVPDVFQPSPTKSRKKPESGSKYIPRPEPWIPRPPPRPPEYPPEKRKRYPPPRPPEPPRYPPGKRKLSPPPERPPERPPEKPYSPPRLSPFVSTIKRPSTSYPPTFIRPLSAPPTKPKTKKQTKKKKPKKAIKKGKWKRPVAYSHYLSGFGKAITMENLSGLG